MNTPLTDEESLANGGYITADFSRQLETALRLMSADQVEQHEVDDDVALYMNKAKEAMDGKAT